MRFFTFEFAPLWLPALVFLRDFIALQYVFSFEPGITSHAVFVKNMWMLPGTLVDGGLGGMAINLLFAFLTGIGVRWIASKSRPRKTAQP